MDVLDIRCPGCGATVRMNPDHPSCKCEYCGTEVTNGSYVSDRSELVRCLNQAENALSSLELDKAASYARSALDMESESSDAYFILAAANYRDKKRFAEYKSKGKEAKVRSGIYAEADLARFLAGMMDGKNSAVKMVFLILFFFVGFFGLSLSLALGLGFHTLTPLYVTLTLLGILLVIRIAIGIRIKKQFSDS